MSDCSSDGYDGRPDFFVKKIRKAKKNHICNECKSTINIGENYEYISGKWDGVISSHKTCLSCRDTRMEVIEKTGYYPYLGMVGCAYSEMINMEAE